MRKIKQSETVEIMRSQITLNPYNPKRHSDKQVSEQKKNLQRVGYLGGVTWNATTGNLVDGHRRIKAMDLINKYDGTPETDYPVKVEKVAFDDKQEKEQMTFMALGSADRTLPSLPLSLPDRTMTLSSFLMFILCALHQITSGARDRIFMYSLSRSSRATGPKIRVPRGFLSPVLMRTAAFSSKRT